MERNHGSLFRGVAQSLYNRKKSNKEYQESLQALIPDSETRQRILEIQSTTSIYSFKDGLQVLSDALMTHLRASPNVTIVEEPCIQLEFEKRLAGSVKVSFVYS